jgi:hypothetical protein
VGIYLFTTGSRLALGPTQPPIRCVPGALSLAVKLSGRENDHSPPSSAEIKNAWSYTSTTVVLNKKTAAAFFMSDFQNAEEHSNILSCFLCV